MTIPIETKIDKASLEGLCLIFFGMDSLADRCFILVYGCTKIGHHDFIVLGRYGDTP